MIAVVGVAGDRAPRERACSRACTAAARSSPGSSRASARTSSPQVLRYPRLSEADFLRPTALRRHHPRPAGPLPDVRTPRRELRQGLPVHAASAGLAGARAWSAGRCSASPTCSGYNPVQLPRYWTYIRATNVEPGLLQRVGDRASRRLQNVRLIGRPIPRGAGAGSRPVPEGRVVASADDYDLVAGVRMGAARLGRALVDQVARPADALERRPRRRVRPGADARTSNRTRASARRPDARARLERRLSRGHARRRPRHGGHGRRRRSSSCGTATTPGWSATVDGRPAPLLATDYLVQGVAVPAGRHEIRLVYRDDDVMRGMRARDSSSGSSCWRRSLWRCSWNAERVVGGRGLRTGAHPDGAAPVTNASA